MVDAIAWLGALLPLVPSLLVVAMMEDVSLRRDIYLRAGVGIFGLGVTLLLVPTLARYTERKGLFGRDLGKRFIPERRDVKVPEALGIVPSICFLVCIILCELFFGQSLEQKVDYSSSLISVCFMVLLGCVRLLPPSA